MSTMIEPTGQPMLSAGRQFNSNRFTIWTRLLWKDFRQLLPIWITILFGAILCLFLVNSGTLINGRRTILPDLPTLVCCQGFAVLVCLINGVLLFALERENRTHQLLHGLPLHPRQVLWSKLALGIAGSFAMIVVLAWAGGCMTYVVSGSMPKTGLLLADDHGRQAILLIGPVAFFLIGVCAALLAGATFNAFAIATFFILLGAFGTTYIGIDQNLYRGLSFAHAGTTLVLVLAMISVVVWNAQRWVEGRPLNFRYRRASTSTMVADQRLHEVAPRKPRQTFPVLMWQSWRIALPKIGLWLLATVGIYLPFLYSTFSERAGRALLSASHKVSFVDGTTFLVALPSFGLAISLLFCATVFHADHQSRHYQFFQQHVERPRWFWLTRLIPWVLAVSLLVACVLGVLGIYREPLLTALGDKTTPGKFLRHVLVNAGGFVTMGLLTVLAIGQFWSMFVRNFVIAIVFSVITGTITFWCIGWLISMGESLTVFVLPLVIVLFWATWYRARFWLADDRRWRGYVVPISTIAATMALLLTGFDYHRANEIAEPKIDLNNMAGVVVDLNMEDGSKLTMLQFGTPTERAETADLYRQSLQEMKTKSFQEIVSPQNMLARWNIAKKHRTSIKNDSDPAKKLVYPDFDLRARQFVEANQGSIELLIEASKRVDCDPFLDVDSLELRGKQASKLRSLALAFALVQLDDQKIGSALEAIYACDRVYQRTSLYFHRENRQDEFYELLRRWSELPGHSVESLRPVVRRLEYGVSEELRQGVKIAPIYSQPHVNTHWENYRYRGGEREWFSLIHQFYEVDEESRKKLSNLPWLGQVFSASSEQRSNRLDKQVMVEKFSDRFWYVGHYHKNFGVNWRNSDPYSQWIRRSRKNSAIKDADRWFYQLGDERDRHFDHKLFMISEELRRRYMLVRLGLRSYLAEHGEYPETLDLLAPYFQPTQNQTAIPKTPIGGQDFAWFPDGLPENVFVGRHLEAIEFEPNRPVLFPCAIDRPIDFSKTEEYEIREDGKEIKKRGTKLSITGRGWWFDIGDIYLPAE